MPRVSAVIPSRNRPLLVLRAVRSALNQTFEDLEVIVVVDGPDPATITALQEIKDPRLQVIPLEESMGASEARNVGARQASGEWIALLDDDDEWLPEKIEKQLAAAQSTGSKNTLVVCSFILKTAQEEVVVPNRLPRKEEQISEYLFGAPRNGFQTSGFFCSRGLFMRTPWRRLKGLQDIDWFLRVTTDPTVSVAIVPEPLSMYWTESESTITSKLDWRTCFEWGHANRSLMTRKAYSSFIAKVCAHRAREQRAGFRVTMKLLGELLIKGSPRPFSLLMFIAYVSLSYRTRRSMANLLASLRGPTLLKPRTARG